MVYGVSVNNLLNLKRNFTEYWTKNSKYFKYICIAPKISQILIFKAEIRTLFFDFFVERKQVKCPVK